MSPTAGLGAHLSPGVVVSTNRALPKPAQRGKSLTTLTMLRQHRHRFAPSVDSSPSRARFFSASRSISPSGSEGVGPFKGEASDPNLIDVTASPSTNDSNSDVPLSSTPAATTTPNERGPRPPWHSDKRALYLAAAKPKMYAVALVPVAVGAAAAFASGGESAALAASQAAAATAVGGAKAAAAATKALAAAAPAASRAAAFASLLFLFKALLGSCLVIAWLNLSNDAFDHGTGVDEAGGGKPESVVALFGKTKDGKSAVWRIHVVAVASLLCGFTLLASALGFELSTLPETLLAKLKQVSAPVASWVGDKLVAAKGAVAGAVGSATSVAAAALDVASSASESAVASTAASAASAVAAAASAAVEAAAETASSAAAGAASAAAPAAEKAASAAASAAGGAAGASAAPATSGAAGVVGGVVGGVGNVVGNVFASVASMLSSFSQHSAAATAAASSPTPLVLPLTPPAPDPRPAEFLAAAVACGYLYQGPPFRLSRAGLGEPLAFVAFGPLATVAFALAAGNAAFCAGLRSKLASIAAAQAAPTSLSSKAASAATAAAASAWPLPLATPAAAAAAVLVGMTTAAVLFCSHFHQIEGDRAVGKMSPLVRLGAVDGARVLASGVAGVYAFAAAAVALGALPPLAALAAAAASLPRGIALATRATRDGGDPEKIRTLKLDALGWHAALGLALAVGLVLPRTIKVVALAFGVS